MCFSASVSFVVGASLITIGTITLKHALHNDKRYLALATFPLLFGIQQVFEGQLWLALAAGDVAGQSVPALGFLFFAYLLWPFFVPFAANQVETRRQRKRLFRWFTLIGLLFGWSLYLPLLINPEWLTVGVNRNSILYQPALIYDGFVSRTAVRAFYAVIVSTPLLFSSVSALRTFGQMILISVVLSAVFFAYAFVSIWCFFAALLSLYIIVILRSSERTEASRAVRINDDHATLKP